AQGHCFPTQWHYHPDYELVLVTQSTGRRMVGDHIGYFGQGDLVFMGPRLPHVWVSDETYINGEANDLANAVVVQFETDFLGNQLLAISEMEKVLQVFAVSTHG